MCQRDRPDFKIHCADADSLALQCAERCGRSIVEGKDVSPLIFHQESLQSRVCCDLWRGLSSSRDLTEPTSQMFLKAYDCGADALVVRQAQESPRQSFKTLSAASV